MTPKEKAWELIIKFYSRVSAISEDYLFAQIKYINSEDSYVKIAKQCALIAVDEILLDKQVGYSKDIIEEKQYWKQVKTEIENL